MKYVLNKILWYLKQLFPLSYYSHYLQDGFEKVCVWKMLFGKCYNVKTFTVK
jgi:hypothetical protein